MAPLALAEGEAVAPSTLADAGVRLTGGDGRMKLTLRPSSAFSTSIAYKEFERGGADGLEGRAVTAIQEISFAPTPDLSGGLFARSRYADVKSNDGLSDDALSLFDQGSVIYRAGAGVRLFWNEQASLPSPASISSATTVMASMRSASSTCPSLEAGMAGPADRGSPRQPITPGP